MNEEERVKNEAFEKSNPDFCTQFMDDLEERNKASEKKKQNATALRLKGNKFFKQKLYEDALRSYMEALKLCPYDDVAVLTNIAQVFIKMKQSEDALEFLNRALALKPSDTKVLQHRFLFLCDESCVSCVSCPSVRLVYTGFVKKSVCVMGVFSEST